MLEFDTYCNISIEKLKDIITIIFVTIDDLYKKVAPDKVKYRLHKEKAIMSDSEIITIGVIGELLGIDSEKAWLSFVSKNLNDLFPRICERSRFNRTRRNLLSVIDAIRFELNLSIPDFSKELRIVDSFPLPVCKFGRARFCKSFRGNGANYGVCPSKKETYYGYKVHALCAKNGFITDFTITPASVDDRTVVWELVEQYKRHLFLIGDKGYISPALALELHREKNIDLIYMKKNNDKNQYPKTFRQLIFKIRRRIETSFSQLSEQFNIEVVKARSFWGLNLRLQTKILAFNICFFINQFLGLENFSKLKSLVF